MSQVKTDKRKKPSFKNLLRRWRRKSGFSLIEIMIAMSIAGMILVSNAYLIIASFEARRSAARLNTAVFLAENLMNEIKNREDAVDESGEFEEFPGYGYEYGIEEVEWDPTSLDAVAEGTPPEDEMTAQLAQYREDAGLQMNIASGIVIRLRKYSVKVIYDEGKNYQLTFHKGFDIAQSSPK